MFWVEGIRRDNAKFAVLSTDKNGQQNTYPLDRLSELHKPTGRSHKSKLDTDFQEWGLASVGDYLGALGLLMPSTNTHQIFKFSDQRLTYFLPAQVLFKAVFRPLGLMTSYLFRPQGLEQVCVPTLAGSTVSFVMPGISQRTQSCSSLQQPLSWMWCFPSARRMFESVYANACNGVLGCELPFGKARIAVTGIKKDALFLITELTMLQVTTTETPFDFAQSHRKEIIFHEGVAFRSRQRCDFVAQADTTIPHLNGRWDLTDQEWSAIYPIFSKQEKRGSAKRKHELRTLINGIIAKLGSGVPWKKFKFETGTWSNACKLYGECRKDGRWEQIQLILKSSRGVQT